MLFAAVRAGAQVVGTNVTPGQATGFTLSMESQLVVEAVTVKDKKGNFIHGLTAKDFAVSEDGVPQKVSLFQFENLDKEAKPLPVMTAADENITVYNELAREQIAPTSIDKNEYKDRRLLAFYFDMTTMPPEDQLRALTAAETFVRTKMTSADLIALLRYQGGSVDILQDFTADRNRLLSILETMIVGEGQNSTETTDDAGSSDTGAAFGQDDSEFNIFNTDRQLSALETASHMLARVPGKKSLLYFASGLRLNGIDNQAQFHATVDAAIKAGVTFWSIDARGLVAEAPMGDATQGSPGNQGIYTGAAALATTANFQQSQDTMYALAGDTGGKAFLDNNDLSLGIEHAQQAISDYYILGYYTTDTAKNGRFRRVKISLTRDLNANLSYREGYYADKEFAKFNAADKERQLEDALMLEDPITDLTIAMEIDYFQLNRAEYFVPIIVKIPGSELALAKRGGAEQTVIDFIGEIKDTVGGITVSNVRDHVSVKLSDATAAELAKRPIEYDAGFTLLPGTYSIKFLARNDETGRIGTYQTTFTVPNLNQTGNQVAISSVVLSSQRMRLSDAIYNASKTKQREKDEAVNPLVQDGAKLIPSVTRVFNKGRSIYVFLQAYKQSPTPTTEPLFAIVSLYRDGKQMFSSQAESVTPNAESRLGTMALSFDLGVSALAPGKYECQVTILDPTAKKASFWRAPIELVQ
jgi:VWFA-related protein